MSDYPEHEKLTKIRDRSQAIGAFLEWADEGGWHLCEWVETEITVDCQRNSCEIDDPDPGCTDCGGVGYRIKKTGREELRYLGKGIQDVLAEYFGIDLDRLEEEKRAMLEAQRELNARARQEVS